MADYVVKETGRSAGYVMHDVMKDGEPIATDVLYTNAKTMMKDLMQSGDTYQEVYAGGHSNILSYADMVARWGEDSRIRSRPGKQ